MVVQLFDQNLQHDLPVGATLTSLISKDAGEKYLEWAAQREDKTRERQRDREKENRKRTPSCAIAHALKSLNAPTSSSSGFRRALLHLTRRTTALRKRFSERRVSSEGGRRRRDSLREVSRGEVSMRVLDSP